MAFVEMEVFFETLKALWLMMASKTLYGKYH